MELSKVDILPGRGSKHFYKQTCLLHDYNASMRRGKCRGRSHVYELDSPHRQSRALVMQSPPFSSTRSISNIVQTMASNPVPQMICSTHSAARRSFQQTQLLLPTQAQRDTKTSLSPSAAPILASNVLRPPWAQKVPPASLTRTKNGIEMIKVFRGLRRQDCLNPLWLQSSRTATKRRK